MVRYDDLTRYLEEQPEDDGVSLTVAELEVFVGQLPPSSNGRTWWANTKGHVQSTAWLRAGRRVIELRLGEAVVFSPAGVVTMTEGGSSKHRADKLLPVMDGVKALADFSDRS